jgi:hypothetical protein
MTPRAMLETAGNFKRERQVNIIGEILYLNAKEPLPEIPLILQRCATDRCAPSEKSCLWIDSEALGAVVGQQHITCRWRKDILVSATHQYSIGSSPVAARQQQQECNQSRAGVRS